LIPSRSGENILVSLELREGLRLKKIKNTWSTSCPPCDGRSARVQGPLSTDLSTGYTSRRDARALAAQPECILLRRADHPPLSNPIMSDHFEQSVLLLKTHFSSPRVHDPRSRSDVQGRRRVVFFIRGARDLFRSRCGPGKIGYSNIHDFLPWIACNIKESVRFPILVSLAWRSRRRRRHRASLNLKTAASPRISRDAVIADTRVSEPTGTKRLRHADLG